MSEAAEVNFEEQVAKPKKAKAKKRAAAAPEPKVAFPGLSRTACANTCNAKGCAISGREYCAHPVKGGLQAADQTNPAALKRLQTARAQLDVRIDPDRFK